MPGLEPGHDLRVRRRRRQAELEEAEHADARIWVLRTAEMRQLS